MVFEFEDKFTKLVLESSDELSPPITTQTVLPFEGDYLKQPETGEKKRRKSSVYRRLSVKTATDSVSIPLDFNKTVDEGGNDYKRELKDFIPIKVLGQGAYGKVHLVEDRFTGKLFAQKQLRKPVIEVRPADGDSQSEDEGISSGGSSTFSTTKESICLSSNEEQESVDNGKTDPIDYAKIDPLDHTKIDPLDHTKTNPLDHTKTTPSDHTKNIDIISVKRTIYERQILSSINHHPNIVKLFYALQDHDKFYLILEYIPGGELFHHLTTNNSLGNVFKEDDVSFYAAQMALGLRHLHKLGIVYRDLKPENCLLDSRGNLVLTDFGLSKDIGIHDEKCNSIIGTPEYMAPEILKGEDYDYGVDWWSLGCVIYDMMSGKPPFTGNSHKVIQDKILKNKLKLPFYFSLDAKDLLNRLLNKNPSKRFQIDNSWETFTKHRFFRKLNWNRLEASDDLTPPIVPIITDPKLAENFSSEFTSLRVSEYGVDQAINIPVKSVSNFEGFSYTASGSYFDKHFA